MHGEPRSRWTSVDVTISGQTFRLRAEPASNWIAGVLSDDMSGVFPGLVCDADAGRVADLWNELPDMQVRCVNVSRAALGRAGGREWLWSYNLIHKCRDSWTWLNGALVRQGVRAGEEALADWLDAAFTLWWETLDKDGRTAFKTSLERIPAGLAASPTLKPRMSGRDELLAFGRD